MRQAAKSGMRLFKIIVISLCACARPRWRVGLNARPRSVSGTELNGTSSSRSSYLPSNNPTELFVFPHTHLPLGLLGQRTECRSMGKVQTKSWGEQE